MRVGDLFAGIGGASCAVHAVIPDAATVWQSDLVNEAVRRRHFPEAAQLVGDVRALDPATLPRVDLLTAGFPCQDLSVAGKGAGLDGARSGLYSEVLRFTAAQRPERVLIENVPALLNYLPRLSADFRALGYGLTWTVCEAADAGHPHLRRRVFVLAELDRRGRGLVEVDQAGRWQVRSESIWPTVRASDGARGGGSPARVRAGRKPDDADCLPSAVSRCWASPRASDASRGSDPPRAHGGTGGIIDQVRTWATPTASNPNETEDPAAWEARRALAAAKHGTNGIGEPLGQQARAWPTPTSRDYKSGDTPNRKGTEALSSAAGAASMGLFGRRLSPTWVEALMGYPIGWTEPEGDRIPYTPPPPVRGRYPEGWDRSVPWPGFAWEPPRTLPDGAPVKGRADRLRALGNAWCPAQGALALRTLLGERGQIALF